MKSLRYIILVILALLILSGCAGAVQQPTPTAAPVEPTSTLVPATATAVPPTATVVPPTATVEPTPAYPVEGIGPTNFPAGVNPLTGLTVADAQLLERRPILIKVQNLPRLDRPQFGLSAADMVYEYYTEQGSTRFAALFYGQDATQVMPIRSARYFDMNLIRGYKSVFVFGSAWEGVLGRLFNSEFYDRLLMDTSTSCPAICRFEPNGRNYISANTAEMSAYLQKLKIDNSRQNLDGMSFQLAEQPGGQPAATVFTRFSAAIYNRWDYDAASGRYLRFVDNADDVSGTNEQYVPLLDQATQKQIGAENVVVLTVRYTNTDPGAKEVLDVSLLGTGPAYLFRDGQMYTLKWQRLTETDVLSLTDADGKAFPFKPGVTWVEVMSSTSTLEQKDGAQRFTFFTEWK